MTSSPSTRAHRNGSLYRFRMAGYLDETIFDFVNEAVLSISSEPEHGTVTNLVCWLPDEAALVGVINTMYDFGLRLLTVECIASGTS